MNDNESAGWNCHDCTQLNSSWAQSCGRCGRDRRLIAPTPKPGLYQRFLSRVCQLFGHSRDWPEMETCGRCGIHMPLYRSPDTDRLDEIQEIGLDIEYFTDVDKPSERQWQIFRTRDDGTRHIVRIDHNDLRKAIDQAVLERDK